MSLCWTLDYTAAQTRRASWMLFLGNNNQNPSNQTCSHKYTTGHVWPHVVWHDSISANMAQILVCFEKDTYMSMSTTQTCSFSFPIDAASYEPQNITTQTPICRCSSQSKYVSNIGHILVHVFMLLLCKQINEDLPISGIKRPNWMSTQPHFHVKPCKSIHSLVAL